MKHIYLPLFSILLFACSSSGVKEEASFQFDESPAWFWVVSYKEGATHEEIMQKADRLANPNQTSYFFAFPEKSAKANAFNNKPISRADFMKKVVRLEPTYTFLFIPNQEPESDIMYRLEPEAKQ